MIALKTVVYKAGSWICSSLSRRVSLCIPCVLVSCLKILTSRCASAQVLLGLEVKRAYFGKSLKDKDKNCKLLFSLSFDTW